MPLKQSHKGTCLFASMQTGNWTSATVWAASSPGRSTLWHSDRATEITFRGRLQKRPPRSPSPLAWLSSVVLVAVVTHEIIFSVHVQSAIYFYSSEGNIKERWSRLQASPAAICALWLWPTSNSEHPCCLPFDFDGSKYDIIVLLSSVLMAFTRYWWVSSSTLFCNPSCKQCL